MTPGAHDDGALEVTMTRESPRTPPPAAGADSSTSEETREIRLRKLLQDALTHHQAGELVQARMQYEQILREQPGHADALHFFGVLKYQDGEPTRAVELIRKAIANAPGRAAYHNNLGKVLEEQGELEQALSEYLEAHRLEPRAADTCFNLGVVFQQMGRLEDAESRYHDAVALKPDDAAYHFNLGNVLSALGRITEAEVAYRAAIRWRPDFADAHNNLGNLLHRLGRFEEALDAHRQVLHLRPADPWSHQHVGNDLQGLGQTQAAIEHYQQALSLRPALAEAHQSLGAALLSMGKVEQAVAAFTEALRIDPQLVGVRRGLASALRTFRPRAYRPELEQAITSCYRSQEVAHQQLAAITANQLRYKHDLSRDTAFVDLEGETRLQALANDALLQALLCDTVNVDPLLESVLTAMRRTLLFDYLRTNEIAQAHKMLIGSLGLQCFNNEYVFNLAADEIGAVERLYDSCVRIDGNVSIPSSEQQNALLALSMYRPLRVLPSAPALARVTASDWDEPLRALIQRTLKEPLEEHAIEREIESLGSIDDLTSRQVRTQYEESPYPRWLTIPRHAKNSLADSLRRVFPHFTPPAFMREPMHVLVAGCGTGQEPIAIALGRANVDVLAVDLSRHSLAYGLRMARMLGADNIRFLQADILQLHRLGKQFHVIESAGVLHHMQEPLAGWRVLVDRLVPEGLIKVGLYSEAARQVIVAARAWINEQGLKPLNDDIRTLRLRVLGGKADPALAELLDSEDFYTLSACRDLLFHVKEHLFTLAEIRDALAQLGLAFIGFELPTPQMRQRYRELFPHDVRMDDLSAWQQFEQLYPEAFSGMYVFWCQKV